MHIYLLKVRYTISYTYAVTREPSNKYRGRQLLGQTLGLLLTQTLGPLLGQTLGLFTLGQTLQLVSCLFYPALLAIKAFVAVAKILS